MHDAPFGALITADATYIEGREQIAESTASDVDLHYGDELTFKWYSNVSGEIGIGTSINLSLPIGHHLVTVKVIDCDGLFTTATMEIQVIGEENGEDPKDNKKEDDNYLILFVISSVVSIIIIMVLYVWMKRSNIKGPSEE